MKSLGLFLSLLLCMFTVSCTTGIYMLSVEQMSPAKVSFPSELRSVAVVNNLPFPPQSYPERLTNQDLDQVVDGDGKQAAELLANYLAEGNFFDKVVICDSALRGKDKIRRVSPLAQKEVKQLAEELGVDMIISYEALYLQAKYDLMYMQEDETINILNLITETRIKIYLPFKKEPLVALAKKDSIWWPAYYINKEELLQKSAELSSAIVVPDLIPTWGSIERYYFAGGSSYFRDATYAIKHNEWDEAFDIWQKVYASKKRKDRMYAAFNIALYYEIKDNIKEAMEWLSKAKALLPELEEQYGMSSNNSLLMDEYEKTLKKREEELLRLNLQMGRFNDEF